MRSGFSLVELSIVLVILGLLTGGILAGQNLIRAAELRSVVTQFKQYQSAIHTFRDKYFAYPGDITNAAEFWGYPGNNPANCPATAGSGTQTCNGDGDGSIIDAPAVSQYGEQFTFWQHLANAGLIEGTYTGIAGTAAEYHHLLGTNSPRARINNAGWGAMHRLPQPQHFELDYGNTFQFGAQSTDGTNYNVVLTPEEAWNIDTKTDDGKPGQGIVTPLVHNNACTNATSATDYGADYDFSVSSAACMLVFRRIW